MAYRLIDLFSGAGGMTLGFVDEEFCGGFKPVFALDSDPAAAATHERNFRVKCITENIEDWLSNSRTIQAADVVIGGPPCQGFSLLNKKRKGDVRRALWEPYLDVVKRSGARIFVMENVPELLGSLEYRAIQDKAAEMGFAIGGTKLNSANYGAPQTRRRAVIVGWKRNVVLPPDFPPPATHSSPDADDELPDWLTVADAIRGLPEPIGVEIRDCKPPLNLHFGRSPTKVSVRRYKAVPSGGNRFDLQRNAPEITPACWIRKKSGGTDLFGRLWWDRPAVTIRTEFYKPEKGRYLHPVKHRPITHREAARLMGFPDNFVFCGNKIEIARQIGNAVPPPLAGAIAQVVKEALDRASLRRAA